MAPPLLKLHLNFNIYLNSSPTDAKTKMFTHPCNQLKKKRNEKRLETRHVPTCSLCAEGTNGIPPCEMNG